MATFIISSPAYRANGFHGTYYSIAICDDNGDFVNIIGDHSFDGKTISGRMNVYDVQGISFSDSDRFVSIREINVDMQALKLWESEYNDHCKKIDEWDAKRLQLTGGDPYSFFYNKKGKENKQSNKIYSQWLKENPIPAGAVSYYDFLKTIYK